MSSKPSKKWLAGGLLEQASRGTDLLGGSGKSFTGTGKSFGKITAWGGKSIANPLNPFGVADTKEPDEPKTAQASDVEMEEAARREAELLRKRRGRRSTIITGPTGVTDTPTTTKTTLG